MKTFLIIIGFFLVGVASALTMLFLAPRSGKETRLKIRNKSTELRESTNEFMDDTILQARSIANDGSEKLEEMKQQAQDLASEKLDNISKVAEDIKNKIQKS